MLSPDLLQRRRQVATLPNLKLDERPLTHTASVGEDTRHETDPHSHHMSPPNDSPPSSANMTYAQAASGSARTEDKGKARAIEPEVTSPPSSASGSDPDFVDTPQASSCSSDDSFDTAEDSGFLKDARKPAAFIRSRHESWSACISRPQDGYEDDYEWTAPALTYDVIPDDPVFEETVWMAQEMGITIETLERFRREDAMAARELEDDFLSDDATAGPGVAPDSPSSSDDGGSEGSSTDECGSVAAADETQEPKTKPRRRKIRLSQDKRRRRARRREREERQRLEAEAEEARMAAEMLYHGQPTIQHHAPSVYPLHTATFTVANPLHYHHHGGSAAHGLPVLRLGQGPQHPQAQSFQHAGPPQYHAHHYGGLNQAGPSAHHAASHASWNGPPSHAHYLQHHPIGHLQYPSHLPPPPPSFAQVAAGQARNQGARQPGHHSLPPHPPSQAQPNGPRHDVGNGNQSSSSSNGATAGSRSRGNRRGRNNNSSADQGQRQAGSSSSDNARNGAQASTSYGNAGSSSGSSSAGAPFGTLQHNVARPSSFDTNQQGPARHQRQAPTTDGPPQPAPSTQGPLPSQIHNHALPLPPAQHHQHQQHQPRHQHYHQHQHQHQHQQPSSSTSATTIGQPQTRNGSRQQQHQQHRQHQHQYQHHQPQPPRQRSSDTSPSSSATAVAPYTPYVPATFVQPASYPLTYPLLNTPATSAGPTQLPQHQVPQAQLNTPTLPQALAAPTPQRAPSPPSHRVASPDPTAGPSSIWPSNPRQVSVSIAPTAPGGSDGIWGCSLFDFCTFCDSEESESHL